MFDSKLLRPKSKQANEYYTFFGMTFDVDKAIAMVKAKPHDVVTPSKEFIDSRLVQTDPKHVDEVDTSIPGIIAQITFGDGTRFTPLIDGNHRAEKCVKEGKPFQAYILTPEESWDVMTCCTPAFMWQRGKVVNPRKKPKAKKP
jgi:hypothetical protein